MMGMSLLAYMHTGNAGFPVGGSLEFARAIEKRFLELGGEICYKAQVEKILVEDDRAVGVRLYNDEIHRADYVISACDGRGTIFDMLDGAYIDRRIRRMYDGHLATHSMMQISLGVKRDLSAEPHWVTHLLEEPVLVAGEPRHEIGIKHYCFDPSLAPQGRSVVEAHRPHQLLLLAAHLRTAPLRHRAGTRSPASSWTISSAGIRASNRILSSWTKPPRSATSATPATGWAPPAAG